jgi:biotin synthase
MIGGAVSSMLDPMDVTQIVSLLTARGADQEALFAEAREQRSRVFGNGVVLRGVLEVTNVCRVNCDYCPMRRDNTRANSSFVLGVDEIVNTALVLKANQLDVVFLQGGETPRTTRLVGEAIPKIRELYGGSVEILLNLGNKSRAEYAYLRDQGATSYILKHETSDRALNEGMRHETFDERLRCLHDLLDLGFKVGTGMIVGLPGQSLESIAADIVLAKKLGVHMCSASPFVPAPNTPLADAPAGSVDLTLNALAVMRLLSPGWLIPSVSALERSESGGQARGLQAGANVVTVNFSSEGRLQEYLIYGKDRFVVKARYARALIGSAGLQPAGSVFIEPAGSLAGSLR